MGGMPASTETLIFGPEADPDAQVIVPHFLESGERSPCVRTQSPSDQSFGEDDRKCLGRIWYTKKESDTASWFNMWEAVTAVYSQCLRFRRGGIIRGLGSFLVQKYDVRNGDTDHYRQAITIIFF